MQVIDDLDVRFTLNILCENEVGMELPLACGKDGCA